MRLTALGAIAAERARRILLEVEAAEQAMDAARAGRTGVIRITATPPRAETVLAPAAARFRESFPAIELRIDGVTRAEGMRRLADAVCDLHCGGIDEDEPLPEFLRRERFLDMTAGVVAWRGHPLLGGPVAPEDLARYPWIDFDWPAPASRDESRPSLAAILAQLRDTAHARVTAVLPPRRRRPVRHGRRSLARLAPGRIAGTPVRRARPAPPGRHRTLPLPHRLRRPAGRRGPGAVQGAGAGRARHRPGTARYAGRLGSAGRSLTVRPCQWLPLGAGRRMSRDSHPVPLHSPPLRPGAPDTPEGFADCNAVRSAPQPGPACC